MELIPTPCQRASSRSAERKTKRKEKKRQTLESTLETLAIFKEDSLQKRQDRARPYMTSERGLDIAL